MPAFIPLPNGIKIVFVFQLGGKPMTVTIHVTTEDPITPSLLSQIAAAARSSWIDNIMPSLSDAISLVRVETFDVSVPNGGFGSAVVTSGGNGLAQSQPLPNSIALVASLRSGRIGRSYRGRIYIPGLPEDAVIGNEVRAEYRGPIATGLNQVFADLQALGATPVIASYQENKQPRAIAEGTAIQGIIVNSRVDTQRRRLPK